MSITSAIVLYAVIWFMVFLIAIPIRLKTQGDLGEVVPGTHAGAPAIHQLKRKAWITTGLSALLWLIIGGVIVSGLITIRDLDVLNRVSPATIDGTNG